MAKLGQHADLGVVPRAKVAVGVAHGAPISPHRDGNRTPCEWTATATKRPIPALPIAPGRSMPIARLD